MDEKMMDNIRKNERFYRLKSRITIKAIGDATGHSGSWITQFESGIIQCMSDQDLRKVAGCLGVKLRDLTKPADDLVLYVTTAEHDTGIENLEKIRKHRNLPDHEWLRSLWNPFLVEDCRVAPHGSKNSYWEGSR